MKKIKLNLALDGRHGITTLPWEGWEYPEMPGLERIRLAAIRLPVWEIFPDGTEAKEPHQDMDGWKLVDIVSGKDFISLGIDMWPTKDKLIEKALPVLILYAEEIREKVK